MLSEIELQVGGVELDDVYPRVLPDLFDGTQLVILGRYQGRGSKSIVLTGRVGGRTKRFGYEGTFASRADDYAFIPRLWANRKVAYLLSEIKIHGADRELVDEVIELSLEHGIITPYTSYLILEEGTEADRERLSRAAPAPGTVDTPAITDVLAASMPTAEALERVAGKRTVSGASAVKMSSDLALEQKASVIGRNESDAVRYAGGRRFVRHGEEWVDEEYLDDMDVVEIEFLSDEYFELLDEHAEVKEFLALGEKVTFVLDNVAYRISD